MEIHFFFKYFILDYSKHSLDKTQHDMYGTVPRLTWSSVSSGAPAFALRARYARPIVDANTNGTPNHTRPPARKPQTPWLGLAATAHCQYDWSTNTVPKLPARQHQWWRSLSFIRHPCAYRCQFHYVCQGPYVMPGVCLFVRLSVCLSVC